MHSTKYFRELHLREDRMNHVMNRFCTLLFFLSSAASWICFCLLSWSMKQHRNIAPNIASSNLRELSPLLCSDFTPAGIKEITLGVHFTSILVLFVLFFAKLDYQFHCLATIGVSFVITVCIPPFGVHTVPFFGPAPGTEMPAPNVENIRNKFKHG